VLSDEDVDVSIESEASAFLPSLPLVPDSATTVFHTAFSHLFSGWPMAYLIATVVFGIGLVIGTFTYVSQPEPFANTVLPKALEKLGPATPIQLVGRITGMVNCQWAIPPTEAVNGARVSLGCKYALSSGLMEITYDTGAKVILQGPVVYVVESRSGGFMAFGKLTGKVDREEAKGFAVRTPTATVTDLGTEFGVEVDEIGTTKANVFSGVVEVRAAGADGRQQPALCLKKNQGACVRRGPGQVATLSPISGDSTGFVRNLPEPKRLRIRLHNTGAGSPPGQPDPHWQMIVPHRADRTPQQALVMKGSDGSQTPHDSAKSQWILAFTDDASARDTAICTFRTTFDLADVPPPAARLEGFFHAMNHVDGIRINGRDVPVPTHGYGRNAVELWHRFTIAKGLRKGTNVLDMDVTNLTARSAANQPASRDGGVVLFRDDFESAVAVSNTNYPDQSGSYDPINDTLGSWSVAKKDPSAVQVTNSKAAPDPGAFQGKNYLRLRRKVSTEGQANATASFEPLVTVGERVRMSEMIYVPRADASTTSAAQVTAAGSGAIRINVSGNWLRNDGSVYAFDAADTPVDTGLRFTAGEWQKWQIDYDVGARTFTLTIGSASASGLPVVSAGDVSGFTTYASGMGASHPLYVDNVLVTARGGPLGLRVEFEGTDQRK
jgi:hypothetical protein